jgi:regulation of enolase protein 1 (concanavalin A-like superfamily)
MRNKCFKAFFLALLLVGLSGFQANAGSILRVFYDGISGTSVDDLRNAKGTNADGQVYSIFPDGPNVDGSPLQGEVLTQLFEGTAAQGDNYGSMMQGFLEAPQTGAYTFWIASDDGSELWLSTDTNPGNAQKICNVSGSVGSRSWTSQSNQKSGPINLVRGQQYFVRVLHKEGGGGDHVAVGWTLPDGAQQHPIPGLFMQLFPLSYYANPGILQHPKDTAVQENTTNVNFFVNINASYPAYFQWYRGSTPLPITPIPDAILSSTVGANGWGLTATLADNKNPYFRVFIGTAKGLALSTVAKLTVTNDITPPALSSASASVSDPGIITLAFSEPLSPASATDLANYQIDNNATLYAAVMGANSWTVLLYTSVLSPGVTYKVTVNNVKDIATVPNTIAANSSKTFTFYPQVMYRVIDSVSGTSTNDALNNARYKAGSYDRAFFSTNFESPSGVADNYIGQVRGLITPPTTGNYTFYIASDDGGVLYLSTDDNPANKVPIAGHNGWTDRRQYRKYDNNGAITDPAQFNATYVNQKSAPIALTAGKKYYIEAVVKEGGGGDHVSIAWDRPGDSPRVNGNSAIAGQYITPLDYSLGPVTFVNHPQNQVAVEGQPVTFSSAFPQVDGTPPYSLQWYRNGVPISGATSPTYTIARTTVADRGAVFTLLAKNNFSMAVSANASLEVILDNTPPTAIAGALFTNTVSVTFSERVDPATGTNLANYVLKTLSGTAVTITSAALASEYTVNLTATLDTGEVYTLTISNVKDASFIGNVIATTTQVFIAPNAPVTRINNSQNYSVNVSLNTLEGGGADIWGSSDQFVYAAQPLKGNFDFRARIESLERPDNWTKVGLMARETLDADSRNVYALATPSTGQNAYQFQYRSAKGGGSSATGATPKVNYPFTWIRLQRVGSVFYGWWSTDGSNWTQFGSYDTANFSGGALPETVYLGVALTSHTTSATAKAVVSGVSPMPIVPVDFNFTTPPASVTVQQNRAATFTFAGSGTTGPFSYQWQKNGVDIPGATGTSYTAPLLSLSDNGAKFRVVVKNSTSTKTGPEATVTVTSDTVAPKILSAGTLWAGKQVVITFDEALDAASASTTGNYSILSPYRGSVSSVALRTSYIDSFKTVVTNRVVLNVSLGIGTNLTVVTRNVKDAAGNALSGTNVTTIARLTAQDVGTFDIYANQWVDPVDRGASYPINETDFEVVAGGSDIWNNADGFHFLYKEVTGDFDVRVRVESLQYVTDNWAKAGLMVRESTAAGSRNLNMVVDPTLGANVWEQNYRADTDGASTGWPSSATVGPVTYPNAWVRLVRQANTFTAFRSTDGVNWEQRAQFTPGGAPYPDKVLVGMSTTSHNNSGGKTTVAMYRDFALLPVEIPTVTSVEGDPTLSRIRVSFAYPVTVASATNLANYTLSGGLTVTSITLDPTRTKVILGTTPQTPGALYTVQVNNLKGQNALPTPSALKSFSGWMISQGFLLREVWSGIADPLSNLKASAKYPNFPDTTSYVAGFETPSNVADNYSQKLSGYLMPPQTGNYTFYIASDDQGELFLSTDANPANITRIARVDSWTSIREWNKEANQKSAPIALEAGKLYYVEALHSEGGGGDNLAVAWTLPGVTSTPANGSEPISGAYVASLASPDVILFITSDLQNLTLAENRPATLSVGIYTTASPVLYRWQKQAAGGTTWTDVQVSSDPPYTTPLLTQADNGARYRVIVSVPGSSALSSEAVITVTKDTEPPQMVSVTTLLNSPYVGVRFNELIDPASAVKLNNYIVFSGTELNINAAQVLPDGKTVVLTVSQPLSTRVVVFVQDVKDLAGNAAPIHYVSSKLVSLLSKDVGTKDASGAFTDPISAGVAYIGAEGEVDVVAGGSDIWNNSDGFHFVYKEVTSDFDVRVRVENLEYANHWSKAGLMIRESLEGTSRNLNMVVDPTRGANVWEQNYRAATGGSSAGWPNSSQVGPVTYPKAWLRLTRIGSVFSAFRSSNGTDWEQRGQITIADYPAKVLVGMCTTSHDNTPGVTTYAQYRNFTLTTPAGAPLILDDDAPPADRPAGDNLYRVLR